MRTVLWVVALIVVAAGAFLFLNARDDDAPPPATELGSLTTGTVGSTSDTASVSTAGAEGMAELDGLNSLLPGELLSEEEYAQYRVAYYCDLARTTRLNCEEVWRGADANEQCLKLNQYYTYSRHCGEQP